MEDLEQSNNDVSSGESSPSQDSNSSPNESAQTGSQSKEPPFHEHPRFKELIEQRNTFAKQLEDYERRFKDIDTKLAPKAAPQENPHLKMIESLKSKGVEPEFIKWMVDTQKAADEAKSLSEWKSQQETRSAEDSKRANDKAVADTLEKLHIENKVATPEDRMLVQAFLTNLVNKDPNASKLGVQDLPRLYKQAHETLTKRDETLKRSNLAGYTGDKKKDAAIPGAQKGNAQPKAASKTNNYKMDREEALAQVVGRAMSLHRANKSS